MTSKPISLAAHRNTRERRRLAENKRNFVNDARQIARDIAVSGYVVLAWDDSGTSHAQWHMGEKVPNGLLPQMTSELLRRHLGVKDSQSVVDAAFGRNEDI